MRTTEAKLFLYSALCLGGLVFGFQTAGRWASKLDFYVGTSELPHVLGGDADGRWRLVLAADPDAYIVASLARADEDVAIKVLSREQFVGAVRGARPNAKAVERSVETPH